MADREKQKPIEELAPQEPEQQPPPPPAAEHQRVVLDSDESETTKTQQVEQQKEQLQGRESEQKSAVQRMEGGLEDSIKGLRAKLKKPKKKKQSKIPEIRDELTIKIEKVMEEGLKEAYQELSPVERQEFKIKGEQTALQIRRLLRATHIKIKKIFKLLKEWLKMLPGVNRFFIEQEAKIKADKIVAMQERNDL